MNRWTSAILISLSLLQPVCGLSQNKKSIVCNYSAIDGRFYYKMKLFSDSTFVYEHGFKLGEMTSTGKWRIIDDTLMLLNQKKMWAIQHVEEYRIDTILDKILIKVVTAGANPLTVQHFGIRLNSNCAPNTYTNDSGIAEFRIANIEKIYVDYYEEYVPKDKTNNNFLITLDSYPIYTSPRNVTWTDWILEKESICPIECGKKLNHIKLSITKQ